MIGCGTARAWNEPLKIKGYALVIGLPGKGDPGTTGGKSAKIEEKCAPVPGSFWSSGPSSCPRIGDISGVSGWLPLSPIVSLPFWSPQGGDFAFRSCPKARRIECKKLRFLPVSPGSPISGKPMTGALGCNCCRKTSAASPIQTSSLKVGLLEQTRRK